MARRAAAPPPREAPLFEYAAARGKTDTSAAAADKIDPHVATLREKAYALVRDHSVIPYYGGLTADEVAGLLNASVLSIRPRLTELGNDGHIKDSGKRRANKDGNNQIVWCLP